MASTAELHDRLAESVTSRFRRYYVGPHGVLVTAVDSDGRIIDGEPLIADFGDVLPFLATFGEVEFALEQVESASPWLRGGLYVRGGRIRAFFNHDWLLGLLSLYRITGHEMPLRLAEDAAASLNRRLSRAGFLVDEQPTPFRLRSWLPRSSPFSGGYIELWLELATATTKDRYRRLAAHAADAWVRTQWFERFGLFATEPIAGHVRLSALARRLTRRGGANLFKDNTNLAHALLALSVNERETAKYVQALGRWLDGFERYLWNDGAVHAQVDRSLRGIGGGIKCAFSSIDLLCDLAHAGVLAKRALRLATRTADRWLALQWDSGLFPVSPGADHDHLDANVDLSIALMKLAALTGDERYSHASRKCAVATMSCHERRAGHVLAVDATGETMDDTVAVKYQGLLLKLALIPDDPTDIYSDARTLDLLRDR
jgi:hypothetical protein